MENKQEQNDDKTLFQGSPEKENAQSSVNDQNVTPKSSDAHSDKTLIDNSEKTKIALGPERSTQQPKAAPPSQQEPTVSPNPSANNEGGGKVSKLKESSKGFSGTQMAGAAAAAGLAGVAVGTNYSDEIKEAISQVNTETTQGNPTNEASVTPGNLNTSQVNNAPLSTVSQDVNPAEEPNSVEINYTDTSGNTYCVSMTDTDGDGVSDITTGDIYFANGTSIQVVQYGDSISPVLNESMNYAGVEDYQSNPEFVSFSEESNEPYFVSAEPDLEGTLAGGQEIVELTSEDILEETENEITGGVEVTEGPDVLFSEVNGEIFGEIETDAISIADNSEFDSVDWDDFEAEQDSYVANEDYTEALESTDFEGYELPDNYLMGDTNDFDISDFL